MGWQKTGPGEGFTLYTITAAGRQSLGSAVTGKILGKLSLQLPSASLLQGPGEKC